MRQDITISDGTIVHTLDAFPFDSSPNLVTTEQGYRRGDRAVDAWTMQRTFAQFFSDGVFGTPADAFQIAKASSGLAVTIQPGMAVIQGAMGGIKESDGALTVTLDTAAAAGNVCYGIMLRYDNNSDVRSLGIRVVKGVAGSNPQPPAPDTTSAGVMELRLGYVTVPNGATDLSNATVTNEKGLTVCPYAAPFDEIDMSQVTEDARASANEAMTQLLAYFDQYKGAVDAALDDSEATYLQQQISALQQQISTLDIDLSDEVDDETIEYASDNYPTVPNKLRAKDNGITSEKLASALKWIDHSLSRQAGRVPISSPLGPTWETLSKLIDIDSAQTLWSGTWKDGSITVNGIGDYTVLYFTLADEEGSGDGRVIAYNYGDRIDGAGVFIGRDGSPNYDATGPASVSMSVSGSKLTGLFRHESYTTKYPYTVVNTRNLNSVNNSLFAVKSIKGVF